MEIEARAQRGAGPRSMRWPVSMCSGRRRTGRETGGSSGDRSPWQKFIALALPSQTARRRSLHPSRGAGPSAGCARKRTPLRQHHMNSGLQSIPLS
jgi:hypothetical protein